MVSKADFKNLFQSSLKDMLTKKDKQAKKNTEGDDDSLDMNVFEKLMEGKHIMIVTKSNDDLISINATDTFDYSMQDKSTQKNCEHNNYNDDYDEFYCGQPCISKTFLPCQSFQWTKKDRLMMRIQPCPSRMMERRTKTRPTYLYVDELGPVEEDPLWLPDLYLDDDELVDEEDLQRYRNDRASQYVMSRKRRYGEPSLRVRRVLNMCV
jgi:hypothetical protein